MKTNKTVEFAIYAALSKTLLEESAFLQEEFSFKAKRDFLNWQNMGERIVKGFEQTKESAEVLEKVTVRMENLIHEVRKELNTIYGDNPQNQKDRTP
jgi:ribosomal protein L4